MTVRVRFPGLAAGAVGVATLLAASAADPPADKKAAPDTAGFRDTAAPFLKQYCVSCHGAEKPKGGLSLAALDPDLVAGKDVEAWKAVFERVTLGEMPPDTEPRPDAKTTAKALAWVRAELEKAGEKPADAERKLQLPGHGNRVDHDALFDGTVTAPSASPARVWRMSTHAYASFVPRVSGLTGPGGKGKVVIPQPFSTSSADGFKDFAALFAVDEPTVGQLMRNARRIVEAQTAAKGGKSVKEFAALLNGTGPPADADVTAAVRKQFHLVLLREPTADELARFAGLVKKNVADAGREIGVKSALAAVLLLPEALYKVELGAGKPDAHGRVMLAPRELAYALAFALSDDPPDAALLKAADGGKLATVADARRELGRLLAGNPAGLPRVMRFFEEYFEFPNAEEVFKDVQVERGNQWRPEVLVSDTRHLIRHVVGTDKDVFRELLTTRKAFVAYRVGPDGKAVNAAPVKNSKQAALNQDPVAAYGLPKDWQWTPDQPVELPGERAGVLTQPSWLAAYAANNETQPIQRGKWVRERLLGGVVPDLPIGVDAKLPDTPEKTVRERLAAVTHEAYCWQCHRKMNDLGLPFEQFDYLGRSRAAEPVADLAAPKLPPKKGPATLTPLKDVPLDRTGKIAFSGVPGLDGPVAGAAEMVRKIAATDRARQVFVRHAFRFWMGRNETLADAPTLLAADRAYVESGGSLRALLTSLLTSDAFLYRWATR
jgi:mono/diheme cytochrome c family protein